VNNKDRTGTAMKLEHVYEQAIESLEAQVNKLHAQVYYLERELNKYKKLYESRNTVKTAMTASTQSDITTNIEMLRGFCQGVVDTYNLDHHGDDYWTACELPNGSYVDVNLYISTEDGEETCYVTVYPVNGAGQTQTSYGVTLYKETL
jgi:hypothetical protein